MKYFNEREELCRVTRLMFDRFMTNAAGGNISVKVSKDHWIMTPTLMSQDKHCRLTPDDIIVIDRDGNVLEGNGRVTREFNMHIAVYDENPHIGAVVHGHPKECMVFASLGVDLPHVCEATRKLGHVPCLEFAPATSPELAAHVRQFAAERRNDVPVAALLREHGVIVADKTLVKAYDMLERLEYNAYAYMQGTILKALDVVRVHEPEREFAYNLEE
ncbi:MAG: class II aldolase/adducin family protein [Bacillus sp. (in: firmicutes)]